MSRSLGRKSALWQRKRVFQTARAFRFPGSQFPAPRELTGRNGAKITQSATTVIALTASLDFPAPPAAASDIHREPNEWEPPSGNRAPAYLKRVVPRQVDPPEPAGAREDSRIGGPAIYQTFEPRPPVRGPTRFTLLRIDGYGDGIQRRGGVGTVPRWRTHAPPPTTTSDPATFISRPSHYNARTPAHRARRVSSRLP